MVVCRFFLQGNCKFGDMCKFEHQINDVYRYRGNNTSVLRQEQYPPQPQLDLTNQNTILSIVKSDMSAAEEGHQWPLSCYSPIKEMPSFPGLEDQSFEEVRLGYYEARGNGTVDQYCQQLHMILQKAMMQIKFLQNPSSDVINSINSFYSSSDGNNLAPSSAFPNSNLFSSNQQNTAKSFFAAANQKLFGSQPAPTTGTFFGNNQNAFVQPTPSFTSGVQHQSPLTNSLANNSPFFKMENTAQPQPAPLFQNAPPSAVTQAPIFGGNAFGSNAQGFATDDSAYSKLEDLNEDEIKMYQAENFEVGKIPEKPPTKEMCS
ncbi:nucleoporin NUP42-like [Photinus pyralis]|uniref:nucleoporin NUP42-like n=1 Tax=Photinus pyralis TaxID=7054 RepID=UPI0012671122|nr:nucleoporin NUP42-like [Photinus pyralis]